MVARRLSTPTPGRLPEAICQCPSTATQSEAMKREQAVEQEPKWIKTVMIAPPDLAESALLQVYEVDWGQTKKKRKKEYQHKRKVCLRAKCSPIMEDLALCPALRFSLFNLIQLRPPTVRSAG